tara:strand:- start:103 stop:1023 length:921 start_codon:yes stop_codon:yes gene_type:complete
MTQTSEQQPQEKKRKAQNKESSEKKERLLRKAYFEILAGFSPVEVENDIAYLRHFDLETQTLIDDYYHEVFEKAKEKGLLTEEQTVDELKKSGDWTDEDEDKISLLEKSQEKLNQAIANALNENMRKSIEPALKKAEEDYEELIKKKRSLITNTCEEIAERRSSDLIIRYSFYKEDKKTKFFSDEDFELLDRKDLAMLVQKYNKAVEILGADNIKRIALADFFTSYYSLIESNVARFFNKPIHELTYFQVNLLNYAQIFSSILKNLAPPDHIKENPKQLLAFAKSEMQKRKNQNKKAAGSQDPNKI